MSKSPQPRVQPPEYDNQNVWAQQIMWFTSNSRIHLQAPYFVQPKRSNTQSSICTTSRRKEEICMSKKDWSVLINNGFALLFCFYLRATPSSLLDLFLALYTGISHTGLRKSYVVPDIKPGSSKCLTHCTITGLNNVFVLKLWYYIKSYSKWKNRKIYRFHQNILYFSQI